MKKGLVFCGGGSKGAFEMGVWDALEELGYRFDIVTGTSIGCLNATLYAQNDYEACGSLWDVINVDMIMKQGIAIDGSVKETLKKKTDLMPFISKYVKYKGADIKPFFDLMKKYIFPDRIRNSNIELGVVAATFPSFKPAEIVVKDYDDELMQKYILASCSCFPVFPVCKIGDKKYVDGGYYDNLPINLAIKMGAEELVVIDLNPAGTHKEYLNKPFISYIRPSWFLGSFFLFDHDIICKNRKLGYNDAMKFYHKYKGIKFTFKPFEELDFARGFVLSLAKIHGEIKFRKLRISGKTENDYDLFSVLEINSFVKMSLEDYYVRSLEIAGEILDIDHYEVYDILDFANIVIEKLKESDSSAPINFEAFNHTKLVNKKSDFFNNYSDLKLLSYLLSNPNDDIDFKVFFAVSKPRAFLALEALKYWSKYHGE